MPYITQEKRHTLDPTINALHHVLVELETDDDENNMEGNLNYVMTRLLMMVYGDKDSTSYSQINDAIGLLNCVAQEYYRKVAAPYENQKEHDNGAIERFATRGEILSPITVQSEATGPIELPLGEFARRSKGTGGVGPIAHEGLSIPNSPPPPPELEMVVKTLKAKLAGLGEEEPKHSRPRRKTFWQWIGLFK